MIDQQNTNITLHIPVKPSPPTPQTDSTDHNEITEGTSVKEEGTAFPQNNLQHALENLKLRVQQSSIAKVLQCQTAQRNATSHLKQLNASEIKESIFSVIEN